jgi:hypothetical protein
VTWIDHQRRSRSWPPPHNQRCVEVTTRRRDTFRAGGRGSRASARPSVTGERVTLGAIAMLAASLWRRAHRSDDAARVARLIRGAPELFPITVGPWTAPPPMPRRSQAGIRL